MSKELIGHIGVDAGICWIGDPYYILHSDDGLPKTLGKDWEEFCDLIDERPGKSFNYDMGHEGLGVCVSTGYGDGFYPVYAKIDEKSGRVKSVTIEFIED